MMVYPRPSVLPSSIVIAAIALSSSSSLFFSIGGVRAAAILPRQAFTSLEEQGQAGDGTTTLYVEATSTVYPGGYSEYASSSTSNYFAAETANGGSGTAAAASPSSSSSSSINSNNNGNAPLPVLLPGQNPSNPASWTVYNADQVHYPFTVHVPDRVTRNLPPLEGPPPLVLSLSGSGGRGNASDAKRLSGYDGTSRMVRQYYEGNRSIAHTLAAEEMLVVTPICPDEIDQANAAWDINLFPNILAQVVAAYEVDLTRIYLSTYSMGTRAAWPFLMEYPDIFAGAILSSGATFAQAYQLEALLGIPIRNYYGADDESNLDVATINTQNEYATALQLGLRKNPSLSNIYNTRQLQTVGPIPNANHLNMNEVPWQEQVETDGYPGALSWLITQTKPEGATIPAYNASVCTTCIPTTGGPSGH